MQLALSVQSSCSKAVPFLLLLLLGLSPFPCPDRTNGCVQTDHPSSHPSSRQLRRELKCSVDVFRGALCLCICMFTLLVLQISSPFDAPLVSKMSAHCVAYYANLTGAPNGRTIFSLQPGS